MATKSAAKQTHSTRTERERAFLVGVEFREAAAAGWRARDSLEELAQLAATAGAVVVGQAAQRRERPDPATFIGKGKLAEIVAERPARRFTTVIFDDELSPSQQRNVEKALNGGRTDPSGPEVKVIDRTALILDIFAERAHTREGRLQVELAQLEYLLPRLAGQWSHLERLEGAIGTRGPGETQIETDRRLARGRISRLKRQIEDVRRHRALHRQRRARQGIPVVALVGYTNAGKTTLMRALSGADIRPQDKLFATLDPLTRRIELPHVGGALLTDTVGFIQKLPTQLVAAFRATLEELEEADVLLHVVDATHPAVAQQAATVERTLDDLGLADKPRITALNKADTLTVADGSPTASLDELAEIEIDLALHRPDALLVSAAREWGIVDLKERIAGLLTMSGDDRVRLNESRRTLPPLDLAPSH